MRDILRARHYSRRTEQAYLAWIRRFILFHGKRHPARMGEREINRFLSHLALRKHVSAFTQNQALSALLFLYRDVLNEEIGDLGEVIRPRKTHRLPLIMTRNGVKAVLDHFPGDKQLMASLMYGTGMRLLECLRLRVQGLDFARNEIMIPDGKGVKDRGTMVSESIRKPLKAHLLEVKAIHEKDLSDGYGRVLLSEALERKYISASTEWR